MIYLWIILPIILIIFFYLWIESYRKIYIFWTGGFDSTFLIMKYLMCTNNVIQPIYIDGCLDDYTCESGRQNKDLEKRTMSNIRRIIQEKYPGKSKRLLDTIFIGEVEISEETQLQSIKVFESGHIATRSRNQYTSISQVCKNLQINGLIGITKDDERWRDVSIRNMDTQDASIDDKDDKNIQNVSLFQRIRFPIIHLSKKDILLISKQ